MMQLAHDRRISPSGHQENLFLTQKLEPVTVRTPLNLYSPLFKVPRNTRLISEKENQTTSRPSTRRFITHTAYQLEEVYKGVKGSEYSPKRPQQ